MAASASNVENRLLKIGAISIFLDASIIYLGLRRDIKLRMRRGILGAAIMAVRGFVITV